MSQNLEQKIEDLKNVVLDISKHMVESFKVVDSNFESIATRIESIENKVDKLIKDSSTSFSNVGDQLNELKGEVIKIQKVSNYPQEYENLLKISK